MQSMTISALRAAYIAGELTPEKLIANIHERAERFRDHNIWIHQLTVEELNPFIEGLAHKNIEDYPLWGIPFAIKDNIDLIGITTTAGCEEFKYTPEKSATVVVNLINAGAIPIGKTNLDQFATGLNGTRSPFGACKNSFDKNYISGGSSSGSAVSIALGLATFSLGSDTAGSGRVPACFNNLVGLKPSRGLLSAAGMVPACKSLDCMSIFALSTEDANAVLSSAESFDEADEYSRKNPSANNTRYFGRQKLPLTLGIIDPSQLKFFGDENYQKAYADVIEKLETTEDITLVHVDYSPFDEVAKLLYEGPWVAERYLAAEELINTNPEAIFPVVRDIIAPGGEPKAHQLFSAQYKLQGFARTCKDQVKEFDALLMPTAGRLFTIEEMLAEPIKHNSELGFYTNFVNLLDLSAVAVPTAFTENNLPFGITLIGDTFADRALLSIANYLETIFPTPEGTGKADKPRMELPAVATNKTVDVVVCGAHLEGLPLNWQLTERGGELIDSTTTSKSYRMYALAGGPPFRPGLIRDTENGEEIIVEVWRLPITEFGSFVAGIPAPLGIGKLELADGRWLPGFICEFSGIEGAEEITELGGWRSYMNTKSQ